MKKLMYSVIALTLLSSFSFAQPTQGLIGYWPFNGNTQDMSGNGHIGTVYGASLTNGRDGSPNGAYYFDGVSNYIILGNNYPITNQVTLALWFKTTNPGPLGHIMTKYGWTDIFQGFGLGTSTAGHFYIDFFARDQYGFNVIESDQISFADNNWHFVAATFSSSLIKICYDGNVADSLVLNNVNTDISNNYNLILGDFFNGDVNYGYHFQGALDDIRIYNRALSQREINQLYNENSPFSTFTLNLSSIPLNGGTAIGAGTYPVGQVLLVQAIPNQGYGFLNWTENNSILSTSPNYTISLNSNRNLVANFGLLYNITTIVNPTNGGQVTGGGAYKTGTFVTLSAIPNAGYTFANWTENGSVISTNSSFTINVTQNRTITANFSKKKYLTVTAVSATNITKTSFSANWNAVDGATGYYLDVSIDNQFRNILAPFSKKNIVNSLTCLVDNLAPGTLFYYRVFAYNDSTNSLEPSNTITVLTLPTAPAPPVVQNPSYQNGTGFYAYWTTVPGATGYYFDLAIDKDMNSILVNFNKKDVGNVSSFTVTGLTTNMNYYFRVKAYNSAGESDYSNIMQVYLTTGIDRLDSNPTKFELNQNYPNPFNPSTKIQFSLAKEANVKLSVYNILGEQVVKLVDQELPASTYSINFNASNLPGGIYFYRIIAGDFIQTKKMILMK